PVQRGAVKRLAGEVSVVFVFQAEDGIRDRNVTGVQTCALPISRGKLPGAWPTRSSAGELPARPLISLHRACATVRRPPARSRTEIGRASCRERVGDKVVRAT